MEHQTLGRRFICTIVPATQRNILEIDGFQNKYTFWDQETFKLAALKGKNVINPSIQHSSIPYWTCSLVDSSYVAVSTCQHVQCKYIQRFQNQWTMLDFQIYSSKYFFYKLNFGIVWAISLDPPAWTRTFTNMHFV